MNDNEKEKYKEMGEEFMSQALINRIDQAKQLSMDKCSHQFLGPSREQFEKRELCKEGVIRKAWRAKHL